MKTPQEIIKSFEELADIERNTVLRKKQVEASVYEGIDERILADIERIKFDGGLRGYVELNGTFNLELLQRIVAFMENIPPGPARENFNL